jgi:amino acid adenylation domain-containing protein
VEWRGRTTTYRELDREANRWANHLRTHGIGPEGLVGVLLDRSPELLAVLLGIMKAGGGYLPLDAEYPAERISFMLRAARARLIVSSRPIAGVTGVDVVGPGDAASANSLPPPDDVLPDNLAYVLYTSGSTGRPKGVAISHRNAANLLRWARETLAGDLQRALATTSISFDCSIIELFGPLTSGGTVVLLPGLLEAATEPGLEGRLLHGVPSALLELVRAERLPGSVRTVLVGGEPLPAELADLLYRWPSVERVFNVYGPTETTTYATACTVRPSAGEPPSIGRPIANTQVHVCDRYARPVPTGVAGEIYVGGLGVARGYLDGPQLTAERFVPDHLGPCPGGRLYRTGDLGRRREDGTLEFLGRVDQMVKVRGYRVEPEEVRAALVAHHAVRAAVVGARGDGPDRYLIAHVVLEAGAPTCPSDLREHLARSLPDFMVPAHIVPIDRVPLLTNGKVDRAALPAPDAGRPAGSSTAPGSADERALADIWRDVLNVERVGVDEDFFDAGGHSLAALRVQSLIRADMGLELPLPLLFEARTIERLALAVALARNAGLEGPDDGVELEVGEV